MNLKSCPFCGYGRVNLDSFYWGKDISTTSLHYMVICENCKGRGPISTNQTTAEVFWNHRDFEHKNES